MLQAVRILEDKIFEDGKPEFMDCLIEAKENSHYAHFLLFEVNELLYDIHSEIYTSLSEVERDVLSTVSCGDGSHSEAMDIVLAHSELVYKELFYEKINVGSITRDGYFHLAREISFKDMPSTDDINASNIGICWSWDDTNAQAYCGSGGYKLTFKTEVSVEVAMDVLDTEFFAMSNIIGNPDETEFRFRDSAPITNVTSSISESACLDGGFFLVPEFSQVLEMAA